MILVRWDFINEHYNSHAFGTGIIMGYVPYPTGTRVVVAPLGWSKPVEIPLSEIEFVVSPEQGRSRIKRALKDLRKPEAVDPKKS